MLHCIDLEHTHVDKIPHCALFHFRPWDVAQIVPRDRIASSETFEGVLKGMKALLYVLLIIGVWLCAIGSQGSILMLTNALVKVSLQCKCFLEKLLTEVLV